MNLPRILPLLGAATLSLLTLAPTIQPVQAAEGAPYSAKLSTAIEGTRVASDTLWRCSGSECTASRATARPAIVCSHAAREFGKLEGFAFQGKAFDEAAMTKCNAKAH